MRVLLTFFFFFFAPGPARNRRSGSPPPPRRKTGAQLDQWRHRVAAQRGELAGGSRCARPEGDAVGKLRSRRSCEMWLMTTNMERTTGEQHRK